MNREPWTERKTEDGQRKTEVSIERSEMITWKIHKAKANPKKTLLVLIFLLFFLFWITLSFGFFYTIFAFLVLFITLNSYFLPITYTIDDKMIIIDKRLFKMTYPLERYRNLFLTSRGCVLSPFPKKNFLTNFRGIQLFLPKEKEAIIEELKNHLFYHKDHEGHKEASR